jgi:hypothetical protein
LCQIQQAGGVGQAAFVSDLIDFGGGVLPYADSYAHNLGATPTRVSATVVCVADDATSTQVAGDETEASLWLDGTDSAPLFIIGANATVVFAACALANADFIADTHVVTKTVGGFGSISDVNNFRLRIRAWR